MAASEAIRAALAGLPAGRTVGVAVSGGSDSTALLVAADDWGRAALRAATVDHGLRPEAADEAAAVAALCARMGVAHDTLTLDLAPDGGVAARARTARYAALSAWARRRDVEVVLLGHTADDVAEGLVMRLRRGVGVDGLARMRAGWRDAAGVGFARPFLDLRRDALRAMLRGRGVGWHEDPTNADPRHERARTRAAMAALDWDAEGLARSAAALREASDALRARAHEAAAAVEEDGGTLLLPPDLLARLDAETRRRLISAAVAWVGNGTPRGADLARLPDRAATVAGCVVEPGPHGLRIAREPVTCPPPVPFGEAWDGWTVSGPHGTGGAPRLTIGALADDVARFDRRAAGLSDRAARATPALRDGDRVVAAPRLAPGIYAAARTIPFRATLRPPGGLFR